MVLVAATAIGTGCAGPPAPAADVAGVRTAINNLRAAVNAGDTAAFVRLTADGFEVFPPGAEPLRGPAARDVFGGLFAKSSQSLEPFTNEELEVNFAEMQVPPATW